MNRLRIYSPALAAAAATGQPPASPPACRPPAAPGVRCRSICFTLPTRRPRSSTARRRPFTADGKWEEARIEYRAAEKADPTFLAPRLNVACSFVRQERFARPPPRRGAARRASFPGARGAGGRRPRARSSPARRSRASAGRPGGSRPPLGRDGLDGAALFVGAGAATAPDSAHRRRGLHHDPHQEVYAFLPETGLSASSRTRTGASLAIPPAPDRRRIPAPSPTSCTRREGGRLALAGSPLPSPR